LVQKQSFETRKRGAGAQTSQGAESHEHRENPQKSNPEKTNFRFLKALVQIWSPERPLVKRRSRGPNSSARQKQLFNNGRKMQLT
jgi:hypothetical protein